MNALTSKSFVFEENMVRIVEVDDRVWYVAADLAAVLGYRNAPDMVRMLDEDQKGTHFVRTLGGDQQMTVITEGGMWRCVMRSKREEAQRFARWVEDELLPTLRREGRYEMPGYIPATEEPQVSGLGKRNFEERAQAQISIKLVDMARLLKGQDAAIRVWNAEGLNEAINDPEVAAMLADAWGLSVAVKNWIADRIERLPGVRARARALHEDFSRWCAEHGHSVISEKALAGQFRRLGLESIKSDGMWWMGVKLK